MGVDLKGLARVCLGFLLPAVAFGAAKIEPQLAEAAKNRDHAAVVSLLKQHVDVNAPEADGTTALAWAAHWGDLSTAELLIRAGANVNAANDYQVTPLALACDNGDGPMVERLLKAGANPNAAVPTGETPLMRAARTGNVEAVKSLLSHGAKVDAKETKRGQTALMWAAAEGHPEVVRALIDHGADVHARSDGGFTAFLFAAQQGNVDSAQILLGARANVNEATPEDGNALVIASAAGNEALSIFLLEKGADPNAADRFGITPLHYAFFKGISVLDTCRYEDDRDHPVLTYLFRPNLRELAKALLAHGANPNARIAKDPVLPVSQRIATSPVGATPFLLAATTQDPELMRALVASGAYPLVASAENTTPLMMAAGLGERLAMTASYRSHRSEEEERNAFEAVKLAVELGADVNAANTFGLTALHGAAYTGSDAIIRFLVEKGAKVNVTDSAGQTPLTIAEAIKPPGLKRNELTPQYPRKSTADLLRSLGATLPPTLGMKVTDTARANAAQ